MKRVVMFLTLVSLIVGQSLSAFALAQSNTGSLSGTVSGPDGVIPNATIKVVDNATGKERVVTATSEGTFSIAQLDAGTYTVTVAVQGFKTYTANNVKIDVAKQYDLTVALEVGNLSESVTVSAGESLINSTSGELSNTVQTRQIQELPLNGRNPLALVTLQAGTSSNGAQVTVINGQQSSFTNITRDGINVQDNFIRANAVDFIPDRPNVDDTGEFTIITQNAGAELGYGASQIQLVTPRGSNQFHGAAYIYNRNSKLAANDFFRNAADLDRPFLNRNQVGGRIAGPIIKDKLFFFGSYEKFLLRQSTANPVNRTILLPQARNGIFTYLDNSGVRRSVNILNITGLSIDPTVQSRILDNVPTSGNTTQVGDQLNTTGFALSRKSNQERDAYTTRFDYDVNQNNNISGTYIYRKELLMRPDVDNGGYTDVPFGFQDAHTNFLALGWRTSPGASWSNELRGGFQTSDPAFGSDGENVNFFLAVPLITSPESTFRNQGRDTGIYNIQDNAVWAVGQHNLRFGGQLQKFTVKSFNSAGNLPTFTLGTNVNTPQITVAQFTNANIFPGGISTAQRATANALVALLGGIVSAGTQTFNAVTPGGALQSEVPTVRNLQYENISFYFSDQWRAKPNLTLNFGLRYEYYSSIRNPDGLALEPVIKPGQDIFDAVLDPNGATSFVGTNNGGTNFFKPDKNNFAPVFSFAWSPNFGGFMKSILPSDGRTVIRGGYRMSYVNDEFIRGADNALIGNPGLSFASPAINPNTNTPALNARLNALPTFTAPTVTFPRTYVENNLQSGRFGTIFGIDPNLQVPRTQDYNISIERELPWQMAIEFRYVGGRSDNLIRGVDLNQVDIRNNGFLADFIRARNNLLLTGNPACTSAGCQPLTVFPNLGSGGLLTNATVQANLAAGTAADLATLYITNNLAGSVRFLANPNGGAVDVLMNDARYRYNSFQTELRKRFSAGLYFQANYTFQKTLTDSAGLGQTNFEPYLDNSARQIEYSRAVYDTAQVFNFNTIYELPFGQNKPFLNGGGWTDRIFGGFQLQTIIRASTGAPISILDPTGTLNRVARAGNQTAQTNLSKEQIKDLIGIFKTPEGIFYINPSVINPATGRAADGLISPTFAGQVFFNNGPGQTGGLERSFIDGPFFFNWDASLIKNFRVKEDIRVQIRAEAFNVMNRANFFVGQGQNINSANFMRITSTFGPRIMQLVGRIEF